MRAALALLAAAAPALALACASCAVDRSPLSWWLVAGLMAAPYAVALGVVAAIRAASRQERP